LTFEVEAGGQRRRIDVRRATTGWVVTIDGREIAAELVPAGSGWSLLCRPGPSGPGDSGAGEAAASYEIAIDDRNGVLDVHVDGIAVPVTVADPRRAWTRAGRGHGDASGPRPITAPMPGRIVKVLVTPGEAVAARQGLVVVEAMKMENELRSPKDGTVAEVKVSEGMSVEAGAVLVVVE
jgi:biotin carboxyl carrier protein